MTKTIITIALLTASAIASANGTVQWGVVQTPSEGPFSPPRLEVRAIPGPTNNVYVPQQQYQQPQYQQQYQQPQYQPQQQIGTPQTTTTPRARW